MSGWFMKAACILGYLISHKTNCYCLTMWNNFIDLYSSLTLTYMGYKFIFFALHQCASWLDTSIFHKEIITSIEAFHCKLFWLILSHRCSLGTLNRLFNDIAMKPLFLWVYCLLLAVLQGKYVDNILSMVNRGNIHNVQCWGTPKQGLRTVD